MEFKRQYHFYLTFICGLLLVTGMLQTFMGGIAAMFGDGWYILSLVVGSILAVKNGYAEFVQEHRLDIDVLMVVAAVGAGSIGYWQEGALLLFIFSLSTTLEELAMNKSQQAIQELLSLAPAQARLLDASGKIQILPTRELKIGDRIQVLKGQSIPIDGELLSREAIIDESSLTGESLPVDKQAGDHVIGGTINQGPTIEMTVLVDTDHTVFAKIVKTVKEAQERQSHTASLVKRLEGGYVRFILLVVPFFIVATHIWGGWQWEQSFYRGMILLTVASPCALLASSTPATLSAMSCAARMGMIIKGGDSMEKLGNLKAIVFDKTGTLTIGRPEVVATFIAEEEEVLCLPKVIVAAEQQSNHPIAAALLTYYEGISSASLDQVIDCTGKGIEVIAEQKRWRIGKKDYIVESLEKGFSLDVREYIETQESFGYTLVYVSCEKKLLAIYSLADSIQSDSKLVIGQLQELGIRTIMLTGDQERTAKKIAHQLGIDEVVANCLPSDKVMHLQKLQARYGLVGMVGDGVNDAPALTVADIGFAVGTGVDMAIESADVVLVDGLHRLIFALDLSKKLQWVTMENIVFSLAVIAYLVVCNLLQKVSLPLGVIGHECSTILVILNGLRLIRYNIHKQEDFSRILSKNML